MRQNHDLETEKHEEAFLVSRPYAELADNLALEIERVS
jgi:hypothetical protein